LVYLAGSVYASGWVNIFSDDFSSKNTNKWNFYESGRGTISSSGGNLIFSKSGQGNSFPYAFNKIVLPKSNKLRFVVKMKYDSVETHGNGVVFYDACTNLTGLVWADLGENNALFYQTLTSGVYSGLPSQKTHSLNTNWYEYGFENNANLYNMSSPYGVQQYAVRASTSYCTIPLRNPFIRLGNNNVPLTSSFWSSFRIDYINVYCYNSTEICDRWDNDCDGFVDERNVCCAGRECGANLLGQGSCGTCQSDEKCINHQCIQETQPHPVLYSALWRNKTGVIWKVYNGTRINMTVTGKDLKDETINYTIYNSSNKIVASYLHGTYNSTFDYFGWTPTQPGKYNFSAKIISTGQLKRSSNLNVYSPESGCTTDCDDHSVGDEEFYCGTGTNANKIMKKKCVLDEQCEKWNISVNKTCNTTAGETCEDNDGEPRCRGPDEEEHEFCGDYNETECCDDGDNVAIEEINNIIFADSDYDEMPEDGFCGTDNPINLEPTIENGCFYYAENCTCEWNTDENKCITKYDQHRACDDEDDCPVECSYISTNVNNDCDNSGFIIYTVIAGEPESIGENCEPLEETCDDVVEQYPCASAEKLPFFNTIQLIISIVLIACIYLIFLKKFKH
jgi:hypothetical protein